MPESGASSLAESAPVTGSSAPPAGDDEAIVPRSVPLPRVETALAPESILEKLAFASRRGRLAGYRARQGDEFFGVAAFGQYFDRVLVADARPSERGTLLEFRTTLPLTWPAVFVVVTVFTIWPGVWLTKSLLDTYIPNTWIADWTYWWYLPLAVLPLPWMVRTVWRKSEIMSHDSAHRAIRKIAAEVGGKIV